MRQDGPAGAANAEPDAKLDGEDPIARALGYPYPRHPTPLLFDPDAGARDAHIVAIGAEEELAIDGIVRPLPVRGLAVGTAGKTVELDRMVTLIAAGSNGSVAQLARKWRGRRPARPILVGPAAVSGAVSVYSAHITAYGAVPATMHRATGANASLHVLMIPAEELGHMNATESLGVNYVLAAPRGVVARIEHTVIERPLAYVSLRGALAFEATPVLLPDTGGAETGYPAMAQADMLGRAARHAGHTGDIDGFIRRMVADRDTRALVTDRLAGHGRRWGLDRDEIVAGG